jgi:tetratricopeptide (TPR) repeat protein
LIGGAVAISQTVGLIAALAVVLLAASAIILVCAIADGSLQYHWKLATVLLIVGIVVPLISSVVSRNGRDGSPRSAGQTKASSQTPGSDSKANHDEPEAAGEAPSSTGAPTVEELLRRGSVALSLDDRDRALASFERAIDKDPESAEAHAGRSEVRLLEDQPKRALDEINLAIALDQGNGTPAFHRQRARILEELDQSAAAVRSARRALAMDPNDATSRTYLAWTLNASGRSLEALEVTDQVFLLGQAGAGVHTQRSTALQSLVRLDEALIEADVAISQGDISGGNSQRGWTLYRLGRAQDALATFDRALGEDETNSTALLGKGKAFWNLGRLTEAVETFDALIELEPDDVEALEGKAGALIDSGKPKMALPILRKALAHAEDSATVLEALDDALYKLGRYSESRKYALRAISVDPQWAVPRRDLGNAYYAEKDYSKALVEYNHAIDRAPNWSWAHASRGRALVALGRDPEALESFREAIRLEPPVAQHRVDAAATLYRLGRAADAVPEYQAAVDLDPTNSGYRYAFAFFGLDEIGRKDQALDELSVAIDLDPENASAFRARAWILNSVGRYSEALEAYGVAIELEPKWTVALSEAGGVLARMDRSMRARDMYERARKIAPSGFQAVQGLVELELARNPPANERAMAIVRAALRHADAASKPGLQWIAGNVESRANAPAKALRWYRKAVDAEPTNYLYLTGTAVALSHLGRNQEALTSLDAAIVSYPAYSFAWTTKAFVLAQLYRFSEARDAASRALELNSMDSDAQSLLVWLNEEQVG